MRTLNGYNNKYVASLCHLELELPMAWKSASKIFSICSSAQLLSIANPVEVATTDPYQPKQTNMMLRLAFLSALAVGSNAFMTSPVAPARTVSLYLMLIVRYDFSFQVTAIS